MNIVTAITEWRNIYKTLNCKQIGFIPTMGNLHEGHISLCQLAAQENDIIIVSIYVNPTQFDQADDFKNYPLSTNADIELLAKNKIDYLFLPDYAALYPDDYQVRIIETALSKLYEGKFRGEHFTGVLTIVHKLFNIIQPTKAYFGEKDYQQLLLIKKMVSSLHMPIEIKACPTIRAEDGLAYSSRNSRLSQSQRLLAQHFPRYLNSPLRLDIAANKLTQLGFKVDYLVEEWQRRLGAVWLDQVRLIDNVPLKNII